jgi:hypothetical protein
VNALLVCVVLCMSLVFIFFAVFVFDEGKDEEMYGNIVFAFVFFAVFVFDEGRDEEMCEHVIFAFVLSLFVFVFDEGRDEEMY